MDDITSSIKRALAGPPPVERRTVLSEEREISDVEETVDVFGEIRGVGADVPGGEVGREEDEEDGEVAENEGEEAEEHDNLVLSEDSELGEDEIAIPR